MTPRSLWFGEVQGVSDSPWFSLRIQQIDEAIRFSLRRFFVIQKKLSSKSRQAKRS